MLTITIEERLKKYAELKAEEKRIASEIDEIKPIIKDRGTINETIMLTITIEERLKKYAELKAEEKRIASEIDEIKPIILEHLTSQNIDKLPTTLGTFTVGVHTVWKYSPAVEALQKEEKATGIATQITSNKLMFKPSKEDNENNAA